METRQERTIAVLGITDEVLDIFHDKGLKTKVLLTALCDGHIYGTNGNDLDDVKIDITSVKDLIVRDLKLEIKELRSKVNRTLGEVDAFLCFIDQLSDEDYDRYTNKKTRGRL